MAGAQTLTSPNGKLAMNFSLSDDGAPLYTLSYKGKEVIKP
ncbi:MAG: glycoside hydrolase family 97 N-terminal domain-containing protein, partial [Dysgonamonadaceae bacterium]|nr:glycoside hydrolase family 97 N-terminal domain-containing protein [Dysgonamonadaceae bacterium]